ncbi:hypothetical protein D3C72_1966020 [compost metagenome]
MMLAQARPTPSIGSNSSAGLWISGMLSMPTPAAHRHTLCMRLGPKRRVNGTSAKAATKATKL